MSPKQCKNVHYNLAMVDRLWNLKRLCEMQLNIHIPLNLLLKDQEYRAELLKKSLQINNEELTKLVWEVRQMEDALVSEAQGGESSLRRKVQKTKAIKLNYLTAACCALLLVLSGYLVRSFLPLDAGEVFVLDAIRHTQINSALTTHRSAPIAAADTVAPAAAPLFRVHGSNTLGEKLVPRLVESYLMALGARDIESRPGKFPVEKTITALLNGRQESIEIHAHGSSTAFADLQQGSADIGMSSRRIKTQEFEQLLQDHGDLTEPGAEHIIGLDGLAIVVDTQNPLQKLSIADLVKIFSGEVTRWSQLGGQDIPITVYARDANSGTWDSFKSMVLDPAKKVLVEAAHRVESSTELSDAVAKTPGAIGFIGLPYVRRAKLIAISVSETSKAILPTHFTVSTEDYPLSRRLYFYLPQKNTDADAEDFIKFSATERGQSIVEDIGLVSQNIKTGKPFSNNFYPAEMRDLISRSQRLSINFRFKDGSDELDSKAISDMERLVKYMAMNAPKRVQLFGFSDEEGEGPESVALSLRRAQVVEQQLVARGIYPLVARGMGEEAPLASSDTEEGRRTNRRVEVWIL